MAYNVLRPYHLIAAGNMGGNITSTPIETANQDNIGMQLNWTGTPTGAFSFQISMDYQVNSQGHVINAGNWITLTVNPAISASGSADIAYVDFNQLSAPYMRMVYTGSSGSGSLDVFVTAKGV